MLEEGGNHLTVPPMGCPCLVEGPISVAPTNTSNDHKSTYLHSIIT